MTQTLIKYISAFIIMKYEVQTESYRTGLSDNAEVQQLRKTFFLAYC